jgi:hypothetical protein
MMQPLDPRFSEPTVATLGQHVADVGSFSTEAASAKVISLEDFRNRDGAGAKTRAAPSRDGR